MKFLLTLALSATIAATASTAFAGGHDGNPAATVALTAVASDGVEAIGPALGPVGASCTACHRPYRVSRN
jgi:cytochrome c556